ncbi:VOC family protein [Pseudomonas aeruginosa]|jgi:extradiol dioxygenase family protein|nr:hypothetical protein [Salmonella enterica subsp. enterica]
MFHLSLPVNCFKDCLDFYVKLFDADVVMLSEHAANLFVFGGQITFHDKQNTPLSEAGRDQMHFGQVVTAEKWHNIREILVRHSQHLLKYDEPGSTTSGRGKLVVRDPSGNLIEINSQAAS